MNDYNLKQLFIRKNNVELRIKRLEELNAPQDLIDREKDWLKYNIELIENNKFNPKNKVIEHE